MEKRNMVDIRKEQSTLTSKISINDAKYKIAKVKYDKIASRRDRMLNRKNDLENEVKSLNDKILFDESEFISEKHNKLVNKIIGLSFIPTILVDGIMLSSGNASVIGNSPLNIALFTGLPQFACCSSLYGLVSKKMTKKYKKEYRNTDEYISLIDRINECEKLIADYSEILLDLNKLVKVVERETIALDNKVRYLNAELRRLENQANSEKNIEIESQMVRVLNK